MSIASAATPHRKTSSKSIASASGCQLLTGQALLDDMEAYRKKVAATPESARDFLTRLGVMTPGGKVKTLIRG